MHRTNQPSRRADKDGAGNTDKHDQRQTRSQSKASSPLPTTSTITQSPQAESRLQTRTRHSRAAKEQPVSDKKLQNWGRIQHTATNLGDAPSNPFTAKKKPKEVDTSCIEEWDMLRMDKKLELMKYYFDKLDLALFTHTFEGQKAALKDSIFTDTSWMEERKKIGELVVAWLITQEAVFENITKMGIKYARTLHKHILYNLHIKPDVKKDILLTCPCNPAHLHNKENNFPFTEVTNVCKKVIKNKQGLITHVCGKMDNASIILFAADSW